MRYTWCNENEYVGEWKVVLFLGRACWFGRIEREPLRGVFGRTGFRRGNGWVFTWRDGSLMVKLGTLLVIYGG